MAEALLHIENLSKSYGGVHALCGENGAGKSTLIKCLTGVETPDAGTIGIDGRALPFGNVRASEAAGIAVIHQESTVFGDLNTIDNVFVGRELRKMRGLLLDRRRMCAETAEVLRRLGESFDPGRPVREFSVAGRQTVALARALSRQCRLLIMDEPTASLSARETDVLLGIVRRLRDEDVTILYVSHRLDEVFEIADRVTVLRDGQFVATRTTADIDRSELIRLMVGREIEELTGRHGHAGPDQSAVGARDVRLAVRDLCRGSDFREISLEVCAGEIVGLAGLVGAGRSEVARAVFGIDPYDSGEVYVDGRKLPAGDVRAAVNLGLGLVPEDRQHEGLVLPMAVSENLSLAVLRRLTRAGLIHRRAERDLTRRLMDELHVTATGPAAPAETLSGGNQQKLVLGKWLAARPRVLILDEPTRGVDVAAKAQVHRLIRKLADEGMAALVISSELPELHSICDRILVMREGRISGELDGKKATHEQVLQLALLS